jgi:cyanophycinase
MPADPPRRGPSRPAAALAALFLAAAIPAQGRIDPAGIQGSLVIVGGGGTPEAVRQRFLDLAGGADARLVIVPTASERADGAAASETDGAFESWLEPWRGAAVAELAIAHPDGGPPSDADRALLGAATGIWFGGGDQNRLADRMLGEDWEDLVTAVLRRGGVVGGTSAGAAIQSRVMIAGGRDEPLLRAGLDLLPDAIIDQHFLARQRQGRLERAVAAHPQRFGIGIDERTAVLVRGRRIEVLGESSATVCFAASARRPARSIVLEPGTSADLTELRRIARNRGGEDFPPPTAARPELPHGSLLIAGGGPLTPEMIATFVERAGGPKARIVMLPTAAPGSENSMRGLAARLRSAGAAAVDILPQRSLDEVSSPAFLDALRAATGVWFGGGRQWRFVDAYADTPAEPALRAVLERGGVIGGSSAGASIQGEYMPRGSPLGNAEPMAEGYERGLGYLGGVAIDQHLSQRGRLPDLVALVERHPQFLGIGIDEGTAILVEGRTATVLGLGAAHFVHAAGEAGAAMVDRAVPGSRYELIERRLLR